MFLCKELIKARKLCSIFKFIDELSSVNDGVEFLINYCIICSEKVGLDK